MWKVKYCRTSVLANFCNKDIKYFCGSKWEVLRIEYLNAKIILQLHMRFWFIIIIFV